ncbi:hypothetical protein UVI_02050600 [Ustilaginoidea virens]|uniref:Cupin, RmlC-type n=1 Tax=Ustilaginoidea virens TaxID=1159556 RepID=A0A1B5KX65_USTVR|nr:hypothetical protein UVI_02050600 [Ustilaginoidea virens]
MPEQQQSLSVIERSLPNGVRYDLSSPGHVTISLPPTSTWSSGLHWHETHTEYLKVVQGSIKVRVGSARRIITASATSQPEVRVDKFVWHEWQRAEPGGEEVVVVERTDPADAEKALFFWNLNGVVLSAPKLLSTHQYLSRLPETMAQLLLTLWVELNLMVIFAHLDNIPVYVNLPSYKSLRRRNLVSVQTLAMGDWVISHFVLSMAALLGWLVGVHPVDQRYTPEREYALWTTAGDDYDKDQT